jgi:hypothetical protein
MGKVSGAMRSRVSEWDLRAGRLTGCDRWCAEGEHRYTDQTA